MKLEQFANEIVAKNHFLKASFGGFAGAGKSLTASMLSAGAYKQMGLKKPILIIDNEKGSRFLIPFFKKELPDTKVYIKDTTSLVDVLEAMDMLNRGEIDLLHIDSLTKVWYAFINEYKEKNRVVFMQMLDWAKILPDWQAKFSDRFVNISGSIVFTGRGGYTYEKEEDTTDLNGKVKKGAMVKSGVKMKMAGETPFEPDLNIWMEMEQIEDGEGKREVFREATIFKDRSGVIDGKTFKNPTYKDFKPVVDFIIGLPTGEVAGETSTSSLAPTEDYTGRNKQQQKGIYLEEIENVFTALSLGTSVDAKKLKVYILEKLFKTASWKAIEIMKMEDLEVGVIILKDFKLKYLAKKPETFEESEVMLKKSIEDCTSFNILMDEPKK
ncbi:MAG TPA: hypothetical protein VK705_10135 [Ferruginibacter sp.]|jgi:hypothetical protein|nr:hypothetical protein [Ferruginibacter sp.]